MPDLQDFQPQLFIQCEPGHLPQLIDAIDAALCAGWQRDHNQESRCAPTVRPFVTCYRCDSRNGREAAILALWKFGNDFLFVSNIAFAGSREVGTDWNLTPNQHKTVLVDFHDSVLSNIRTDSCLRFAIVPRTELPPPQSDVV